MEARQIPLPKPGEEVGFKMLVWKETDRGDMGIHHHGLALFPNGFGVSVVYGTPGDRWSHGLYGNGPRDDSYELMTIHANDEHGWELAYIPGLVEGPEGWLTAEQIGWRMKTLAEIGRDTVWYTSQQWTRYQNRKVGRLKTPMKASPVLLTAVVSLGVISGADSAEMSRADKVEAWLEEARVAWAGPRLIVKFESDNVFDVRLTSQPLAWAAPIYEPWASEYGYQCSINLGPEFWTNPGTEDKHRRALVFHEYGHCLGLDHASVSPSIMNLSSLEVTEGDKARMRAESPYWHGRRVIMVAGDGQ